MVKEIFISVIALSFGGCWLNDGPPDFFPGAQRNAPPAVGGEAATSETAPPEEEGEEEEGEGEEGAPSRAATVASPTGSASPRPSTSGTAGGTSTGSGPAASSAESTEGSSEGPDEAQEAPEAVSASASLTISPPCLRPGSSANLSWQVTGADSISIVSPLTNSVIRSCFGGSCAGSAQVPLSASTTFTLSARKNGTTVASASAAASVEPRAFATSFEAVKTAEELGVSTINDVSVIGELIYLATPQGIRRLEGDSVTSMTGGGLPNVPISSVMVDPEEEGLIYAAASGHLYESTDDGESWDVIHFEDPTGNHIDLKAVASRGGHCVVGSARGIYHGHVGEDFVPTNVTSGSVLPVFAGTENEGFFAIKSDGVYRSSHGDTWSRTLATSTAKFIERPAPGTPLYLIVGGSAYRWNSSSWALFVPSGVSGPIKAVGEKVGVGSLVVGGSSVWVKPAGAWGWEEADLTGDLPEIKGLFATEGGRLLVWEGAGVYEWNVSEVPLSCAGGS